MPRANPSTMEGQPTNPSATARTRRECCCKQGNSPARRQAQAGALKQFPISDPTLGQSRQKTAESGACQAHPRLARCAQDECEREPKNQFLSVTATGGLYER